MKRIGWIGTGRMGRPMVVNVLKAGIGVLAYDKDASRVLALREHGVEPAADIAGLMASVDDVVSMVFDDSALLDVAGQIARHARPGLQHMDMSTVSPAASAQAADVLARAGVAYLRAPVSGTVAVAQSAALVVYTSGPAASLAHWRPVLEAVSAKQTHVGTGEEARLVKLLINMVLHMNTAVMGEALSVGDRAGIDRHMLVDAINDSVVGSPHTRTRAAWFKAPDTSPDADLALTMKDLGMALDVARSCGAALPLATLVREFMTIADNHGRGNRGVMALATVLDDMNPRRA